MYHCIQLYMLNLVLYYEKLFLESRRWKNGKQESIPGWSYKFIATGRTHVPVGRCKDAECVS